MRRAAFVLALVLARCGFEGTVLTTADASAPDVVIPHGDATTVAAGESSACTLIGGAAVCWGNNGKGAVGSGDLQNRTSPITVMTSVKFDAISVGENHACGIEQTSLAIDCWGDNSRGQLGVGDTTARLVPAAVTGLPPAKTLTSGYNFACVIGADGSLWCWGENCEGEMAQNDSPSANAINACNAGATQLDALLPVRVGTANDWIAIAGGQGHVCGLRGTGTLWCWGRNTEAELGLGNTPVIQFRTPQPVGSFSDWTQIDLGQDNGCGIRSDGSLWCWGNDTQPTPSNAPLQVGTDVDWTHVDTDLFSWCAVKKDGRLFCWGQNGDGELGVGDQIARPSPTQTALDKTWETVSVGRFFTCAKATDATLECTGANESGELGVGDTTSRYIFTPVALQ